MQTLLKASTLLCAPPHLSRALPSARKAAGCSFVKAGVSPGSPSSVRTRPTRINSPRACSLCSSVWPRAGGGTGSTASKLSQPRVQSLLHLVSHQNKTGQRASGPCFHPVFFRGIMAGLRGDPHCAGHPTVLPLLSPTTRPRLSSSIYQTEAATHVNHCG